MLILGILDLPLCNAQSQVSGDHLFTYPGCVANLTGKAPSCYQCFEWRAQGGGQNVHLDTLALEQGIHQLKAPFHASGLDIGIRRHGFVQLIHLAHWQW